MINEIEDDSPIVHNDQLENNKTPLSEHNHQLSNENKEAIDKTNAVEAFIQFQRYLKEDDNCKTLISKKNQEEMNKIEESKVPSFNDNNAINEGKVKRLGVKQSKSSANLKVKNVEGEDQASRNKNCYNGNRNHKVNNNNQPLMKLELSNLSAHLNYLNEPSKPVVPVALSIKKDYNDYKASVNCSFKVFNKDNNTKREKRLKHTSVEPKGKTNYQPFSLRKSNKKVESKKKLYACDNITASEDYYTKRKEGSRSKQMYQTAKTTRPKNKSKEKFQFMKNSNMKAKEITIMINNRKTPVNIRPKKELDDLNLKTTHSKSAENQRKIGKKLKKPNLSCKISPHQESIDTNFNLLTHNNSMLLKEPKTNIKSNTVDNSNEVYMIKAISNDLISFGGKVNNVGPLNDITAYSDRKILTPSSQQLSLSNRPKGITSPPMSKIDPKSPTTISIVYSNPQDDDHYLSDNQHNLNEYSLLALKHPTTSLNNITNNNSIEEIQINSKLIEMNKEINRLKNENNRVSKLKEDYEALHFKIQREYKEYAKKKDDDQYLFDIYKEEEMKKIQKERKQLAHDQKIFNDIKIKTQTIPSVAKKDKDQIEVLKNTITKMQEEFKLKENNNKLVIEKYKKQLDEANSTITKLNEQISVLSLSKLPTPKKNLSHSSSQNDIKTMRKSKSRSSLDIKQQQSTFNEQINQQLQQKQQQKIQQQQQQQIAKQANVPVTPVINQKKIIFGRKNHESLEEDDIDTFDIVFLDKYHKAPFPLIKQETGPDKKIIRYYEHNKKEIIFPSGVRKEIYGDGYQIIYFNNGDLKQLYPDGKAVYYFSEAKTIQTTFKDLQVFKFENGQIEKHFKDGTKQIALLDGSLKHILPDGTVETYYFDGRIEKITNDGIVSIEHEDGRREVHYPPKNNIIKKS